MKRYLTRNSPIYAEPDLAGQKIAWALAGDVCWQSAEFGSMAVVEIFNKVGFVPASYLADFVSLPFGDIPIHIPGDNIIADARFAGRSSQYVSLRSLGIKRAYNKNLCGEFCAASLAGFNLLDLLTAWLAFDRRAKSILAGDKTTGAADLRVMLASVGVQRQPLPRLGPAYQPVLAGLLEHLPCIAGVGLDSSSYGRIKSTGSIRHWVVIYDVFPQANTAWCLVYNPFWHRLETVLLDQVVEPNGNLTIV